MRDILLPRCLRLALAWGILFPLPSSTYADQKGMVADFEDVGTWRLKSSSGLKPGLWFAGDIFLSGSTGEKRHDQFVGELKFAFDSSGPGPFRVQFERKKMSLLRGFLTGVEFEANPRGLPVSVRFVIEDARHRTYTSAPVLLEGDLWRSYRLAINEKTIPRFSECRFPASLKAVVLEADHPCEGSVFLDDIRLTGQFTRRDRLSLFPVYDDIYYDPGKPVVVRYRLRNGRQEAVEARVTLEATRIGGKILRKIERKEKIPGWGNSVVEFDLGLLPVGAYSAFVTAAARLRPACRRSSRRSPQANAHH